MGYTDGQKRALLDEASSAIARGLEGKGLIQPDPSAFEEALREKRATFVTLKRGGRLRGCVGTLAAYQPLVMDVAEHAFAAAFRDPRFDPLSGEEFPEIILSISVLGLPEPLAVRDERELLAVLRPGVDGLILEDGPRKATFLPSVWEELPIPADFVRHLKMKAGLSPNHWPAKIRLSRYAVEKVE